jgi:pyruvate,water dikinase
MITLLKDVTDADRFGGKAAHLAAALRRGLPVPDGAALAATDVVRLLGDPAERIAAARWLLETLGAPLAVRSSAIGEDGAGASFAGQHTTVLNVRTPERLAAAILEVHASGAGEAALAYRSRLGLGSAAGVGVVVQRLVASESAGVLFTRDPMGSAHLVVEAAWGLGEAVVAGLVTPDHYRLARDGTVLDRRAGDKDLAVVLLPEGTEEVSVSDERARALCLDDASLRALHDLALACEDAFGEALDIEWAFAGGVLFLLQWRPITT